MISVDFISARMPANFFLALVTISGSWQKKMRKFLDGACALGGIWAIVGRDY
jgi:hypothetical protein